MRSAICSRWSEWELRKAGPPMTLSDDPLYGDVLGPLAVLPRLVAAGHGVAASKPAVEAGRHLLLALASKMRRTNRRTQAGATYSL